MRPDCKNKRTFKFARLLESVTSDEKGKSDKGVVFGAVVRCGRVRRICRAGFVQKRRRAGREWLAAYDDAASLISIGGQIPEPSVYAAILGALSLALAAARRRGNFHR